MKKILPLALAMLFLACGQQKKTDDQDFQSALDSLQDTGPKIDETLVNGILQQIPSPLEIASILKESGSKYESSILNSDDNLSRYNTNFTKALNLGVFGTDLGYTNIYEQSKDGINFLTAIKSLANDLNIGQFFDIETIGRLASNSKNLDSLLLITTQNFNDINTYLQNQGRSQISVLLLTGGWIEAMQIICQTADRNSKNKDLPEKIGEQKIILEQLTLLLSFFEKDTNMASLLKDLRELETAYKSIEITTTYKESTMKIVDGVAMITDNSTTSIKITPEDVKNITRIVAGMRNKIIN
jgi:cell fate (sporulation/competence/biofilm development) regulator YlbF (YheA/YmcA/DUF963 family)